MSEPKTRTASEPISWMTSNGPTRDDRHKVCLQVEERLREANRRLQAEGPALERDKVITALQDRLTALTQERDTLQREKASLATMLGWANVPPQDTVEAEIRAMKARIASLKAERDTLVAENQALKATIEDLTRG